MIAILNSPTHSYLYLKVLLKWNMDPYYICMTIFFFNILCCDAVKKNWMYGKSWIENYRLKVEYGLPWQSAITEFLTNTHVTGVVDRDYDAFEEKNQFSANDSFSFLSPWTESNTTLKGTLLKGYTATDMITVLNNSIPSVRTEYLVLNEAEDDQINFIGLLEAPWNKKYLTYRQALQQFDPKKPVAFAMTLCGNPRNTKEMYSKGYVEVAYGGQEISGTCHAAMVDNYVMKVMAVSLAVGGGKMNVIGKCKDLNAGGIVLDNSVPGIYLPAALYKDFISEVYAYATLIGLKEGPKIWEKQDGMCFKVEQSKWDIDLPKMRLTLFTVDNQQFDLTYPGSSLAQRYYTEDEGDVRYCYHFSIRMAETDRIILGRAAFHGVTVILNTTRQAVSFRNIDQSVCGIRVDVSLPKKSAQTMDHCDVEEKKDEVEWPPEEEEGTPKTNVGAWIWAFMIILIMAALTCMISAPRPLQRGYQRQPQVRIFLPRDLDLMPEPTEKEKKEAKLLHTVNCECDPMGHTKPPNILDMKT